MLQLQNLKTLLRDRILKVAIACRIRDHVLGFWAHQHNPGMQQSGTSFGCVLYEEQRFPWIYREQDLFLLNIVYPIKPLFFDFPVSILPLLNNCNIHF